MTTLLINLTDQRTAYAPGDEIMSSWTMSSCMSSWTGNHFF